MQYNFEKLEVYGLAENFISAVYQIAKKFPREELFGLGDQIKRASVSVALNIAEGSTGRTRRDFLRYLTTAIGSVAEVKAGLNIALKLRFASKEDLDKIEPQIDELFFKLVALKKSVNV